MHYIIGQAIAKVIVKGIDCISSLGKTTLSKTSIKISKGNIEIESVKYKSK